MSDEKKTNGIINFLYPPPVLEGILRLYIETEALKEFLAKDIAKWNTVIARMSNSPLIQALEQMQRQSTISLSPKQLSSGLNETEETLEIIDIEIKEDKTTSKTEKPNIETMQTEISKLRARIEVLENEKMQSNILSEKTKGEINLQTKPAGRKVDPWNPIAYEILIDGNENAEKRAFKYWCKEQEIINPEKRERDAFKKAMKRAEKRRRRNR